MAGLVLGAVPLIVTLLQTFLNTTGEKKLRKTQVRKLKMEVLTFKDTCAGLLEGLVPPEHAALLLDGVGWDDPKLRDLLNDRIGMEAAEVFIDSVTDLGSEFDNLRKMLGLDGNMKVCRQYASELTPRMPWTEISLVVRQSAKTLGPVQTCLRKGFSWQYL